VENDGIGFGVGDIFTEVVDLAGGAGFVELVVHPTKKDFFGRELEELLKGFSFLKKTEKFWVSGELDILEKAHTDKLPCETKAKVGSTITDIFLTNVDGSDTKGTDGVQGKGDVLKNGVGVELLATNNDLWKNGIFFSHVNHSAEENTIMELLEEFIVVWVDWKVGLGKFIIFKNTIDVLDETRNFFLGVHTDTDFTLEFNHFQVLVQGIGELGAFTGFLGFDEDLKEFFEI
jgi:hypothetical protein